MLTWKRDTAGDLFAVNARGIKVYSVEKLKHGWGLRRWWCRLDGTAMPGALEHCKTAQRAKDYANNLHARLKQE